MSPEELARVWHEEYERLAPEYGYITRQRSRTAWALVPQQNRDLMVATATAVLELLYAAGLMRRRSA